MNLLKHILFFLMIISFHYSQCQEGTIFPKKNIQKGFLATDFLSIDMPNVKEKNMVLSGIHYNLKFNKFYTGLGMYGSIMGIRGGFFTLGVNTGFQTYLSKNLFINSGIHFGAGGGAGTPDGGGAFILPRINFGLQFKNFSLSSGYSYINFFDNGDIKNHQINLEIQIPFDFSSSSFKNAEKEFFFSDLKKSKWNKKYRKMSFMFHLNNLSVIDNSNYRGKIINLAGFEINSYINSNWFYFAKFDGAYNGIKSGYMNIILGAGHQFFLNQNKSSIITKLGIGSGGGGGVESEGGLLIFPDVSFDQRISNNIYVSINKGFLMSPNSFFKTSTLGIGLKYYSNINELEKKEIDRKVIFKGVEFIIKQDSYLNAKRIINDIENLHQISLQLNYHLNKNMYVAGQTSFANFGNAGAYAEGIIGMGLLSNNFTNENIKIFVQGLVGGAGGGNISTGEGLIIKPSFGMNYKINSIIALRTTLGYVTALDEGLSSPSISLGLSYRMAFLNPN